ncbi:MAG: hypothetical protein IPO91_28355 [Chloroflexi bacterium]|nr:hypothetical protein [Chloroflexota bacterium]
MRGLRRFLRRGQSGQALFILAIGFIALVGFVGIVTDVSVLFIRYSTLGRAVDAAAVSAASQMRRIEDTTFTDANSDGIDDIAEDEAGSVANLNLAARSFIELYGLDPSNVIVETCRAQQVGRDANGNPLDENNVPLFNLDGTINTSANQTQVAKYQELCTEDELKLVRVTAQIDAPTMFLYLLGYPTVTLTASAMSQTAVLDVVLILDVSESMLNETTYADWENVGQGMRYLPPVLWEEDYDPIFTDADSDGIDDAHYTSWDYILTHTQAEINAAVTPAGQDPLLETLTSQFAAFDSPTSPGQLPARAECQIRAWPRTQNNYPRVPDWLLAEYNTYLTSQSLSLDAHFDLAPGDVATSGYFFSQFVPMYNFYGCCNDPDGLVDADGNFSFGDLVCQPFREARDAAEGFLTRLDFKRGDRVAFVTFDRFATLIDPDGPARDTNADGNADVSLQDPFIETETSFTVAGHPEQNRIGAVETLRNVIGVRAETGSYVDTNNDGQWDAFRDDEGVRDDVSDREDWANWADLHSVRTIGEIQDQPVRGACPFDMVSLRSPFSPYKYDADGNLLDANAPPPLNGVITVPVWVANTDYNFRRERSYENRASCGGTNIGGALGTAANALYFNGRREGAVWIMVLLSDGAAGVSDPMSRVGGNAANIPDPPQPFRTNALTGGSDPLAASAPAYGYASFGLCPYGAQDPDDSVDTDGDGITTNDGWGEVLRGVYFPYCGDRYPQTRHFCATTPTWPNQQGLDENSCITYYDVDDYARDWADWVGLADLTGAGSTGTGRVSEQLLPTIFTIGFGLNFDNGACSGIGNVAEREACQRGITLATGLVATGETTETRASDYLGEELLRYIGDVGDNFRMDNDYWQSVMGNRIPNTVTGPSPDWGGRGPCETESGVQGVWSPLAPQTSCGNYFSAQTGSDELTQVFNEIAARMFTRLSR